MSTNRGFTTTILHSDRLGKPEHGALHKPIHTAVTYGFDDVQDLVDIFQNKKKGYAYSRQGNPTVSALEHKVTQMENGMASICFSTGMAAISATILSLMKHGDHVLASSYLFGNTRSVFQSFIDLGLDITFTDATSIDNITAGVKENTRMIFVETIANPGTQIADLAKIGDLCQEKGIIYVVDNTMTSPYLFKPVNVKASLVINALTKYIGGHGNALGGSVTDTGLYDWSNFPNIFPTFKTQVKPEVLGMTQIRKKGLRDAGGTLSPEAAHVLSVGSETLALRMERACTNALALATFFESHPLIKKVYYPGLKSHPQHGLAGELFTKYGALMSFELDNSIDLFGFLNKLKLVIKSSNLGDTRTLAIPVAHTIFNELGAAKRAEMGIDDSLIRLSVGIEDLDDLLEDFKTALGD
ncbi:cystathionine gamma-synthase family protein [Mucilaginibacter sp. L3T2-6]|uniref:cystathionine gamma-synthase family protein n=1 Tax=Mucilaginibacter sp. L3T2-6 TaxID=3062491 RepID=UPI00267622F2|nr:cystathionine gamma-synthase family protein [Mucilaginibacter sp. L3T2-6]MDO3644304.1 cystathionine gamma-synthase family protein [Mucilaginibacter sp. L3T2-6]MDV6216755.1 cystathionine gamma-synthase family protein [Mucilaginibacter sp. L3T2-6]